MADIDQIDSVTLSVPKTTTGKLTQRNVKNNNTSKNPITDSSNEIKSKRPKSKCYF